MKKKLLNMVLIGMVAASVCACGTKKDDSKPSNEIKTEKKSEKQNEIKEESSDTTEKYESELGYTIEYDYNIFEVIDEEDFDGVEKIGQDLEKETPVYLYISSMENEKSKIAVKGLKLTAEKYDSKIEATKIGKESYSAQKITSETKRENLVETNIGYIVKGQDKEFLIEIMFGNDTLEEVRNKLDEMIATFTILDKTDGQEGSTNNLNKENNNSLEGEFAGWVDEHTVEVNINGKPKAYQVEDENVKKILSSFDEGSLFTFEATTKGGMTLITNILGD